MSSWFPIQDGRTTVVGAALVVVVFSLIGLGVNAVRGRHLPLIGRPPALAPYDSTAGHGAQQPRDQVQTVTLEQAAGMFFDPTVCFVDSRDQEAFAAGHVEGAVNISAHRYDEEIRRQSDRIGKASKLVVYCDGGACEASLQVARRLVQSGYKNVLVFSGGWPEWVSSGYPTAGNRD